MRRHLLRFFQSPAIAHVLRNSGRTKCVRADVRGYSGGKCSPFDHPQCIVPVHHIRRQVSAAADGAEEGSVGLFKEPGRRHVLQKVFLCVVMHRHFVVPPAFLVKSYPVPAIAEANVSDSHFERSTNARE